MTDEEKKYKKDLDDAGVDLEDEIEDDEEDEEEEDKSEDDSEDEEEDEEEDDDSEDDSDEDEDEEEEDDSEDDSEDEDEEEDKSPKSKKKPSIYSAYKEKKKEVKSLKTEMETMKQKITALESAGTKEDKEEALDDLEAFAKKVDADPAVIKEMRTLFLKGLDLDPNLKKDLLEFKEFKGKHEKEMALSAFNEEFKQTLPSLKELFPKATEKEVDAIKVELEKLVHSKGEWNDKSLDYVLFKNKGKFSKLLSPKKKGMETRERKDAEEIDTDFDPEADLSSMSGPERVAWEKKYKKLMKTSKGTGLSKDSMGKKILI